MEGSVMSKGLIFSDLHLHKHKDRCDRLQHCLDVLTWVFDQAVKNDCDDIFFLGDLFHERSKIDVLNYLRTFETIMERMLGDCKDKNLWMLVGNHDMYHRERWDVNSIKPLTAIPNVHIIDSPMSTTVGSTKIDWMPHTENPVHELQVFKEDLGDILFGHLAVHGAQTNTFYGTKSDVIVEYDNEMVEVDASVFDDWKATFLGHYHGAQHLNDKVEYVGSPLQLTFGEAFQQKHIIVLDLETLDKEYIVNDFSPKHLIISPQDIEHENYDFNGQFLRISVDDMGALELIDLKRKLAKDHKPLSIDLKEKDKKVSEEKDTSAMEDIHEAIANIEDMLGKYMKEKDVPDGLDKDRLLKAGMRCLDKQPG